MLSDNLRGWCLPHKEPYFDLLQQCRMEMVCHAIRLIILSGIFSVIPLANAAGRFFAVH